MLCVRADGFVPCFTNISLELQHQIFYASQWLEIQTRLHRCEKTLQTKIYIYTLPGKHINLLLQGYRECVGLAAPFYLPT